MRRVAEQERAVLAKMIGDSMMHVVSREPVHAFDLDTHPVHDALADVVPGKVLISRLGFAHRADEPGMSVALQRKHGQEIVRIEADVQLVVHRRPFRGNVSDVKNMLVGPARKADFQRLANDGMGAVASRDVGRFAFLQSSIRSFQARAYAAASVLKIP